MTDPQVESIRIFASMAGFVIFAWVAYDMFCTIVGIGRYYEEIDEDEPTPSDEGKQAVDRSGDRPPWEKAKGDRSPS
jgi:hypothetical protein